MAGWMKKVVRLWLDTPKKLLASFLTSSVCLTVPLAVIVKFCPGLGGSGDISIDLISTISSGEPIRQKIKSQQTGTLIRNSQSIYWWRRSLPQLSYDHLSGSTADPTGKSNAGRMDSASFCRMTEPATNWVPKKRLNKSCGNMMQTVQMLRWASSDARPDHLWPHKFANGKIWITEDIY